MSDKPFNLLIVCRGNINRSPALEALFSKEAGRYVNLKVASAGLNPSDYTRGIAQEMYRNLVNRGFYYEAKAISDRPGPTMLQPPMIDQSDLILCANPDHVLGVKERGINSTLDGKIYTLPEYAGFPGETIPDPSEELKKLPVHATVGVFFLRLFRGSDRAAKRGKILRMGRFADFERADRIYQANIEQLMKYVHPTLERLEKEDKIIKI